MRQTGDGDGELVLLAKFVHNIMLSTRILSHASLNQHRCYTRYSQAGTVYIYASERLYVFGLMTGSMPGQAACRCCIGDATPSGHYAG